MTDEPIKTNFNYFTKLRENLNPDMTPLEVQDAVKAYWNAEANFLQVLVDNGTDPRDDKAEAAAQTAKNKTKANSAAREQETTRSENGLYTMSMMASFDEYLPDVIQKAVTDPVSWDALYAESLRRHDAGESFPPEATEVLRGERPSIKGRPKGREPGIGHRDLQLALAVLAVYLGTNGGYSLATNDTTGRNAFGVVSEATGIDFESVKKAWGMKENRDFRSIAKSNKGKKVR